MAQSAAQSPMDTSTTLARRGDRAADFDLPAGVWSGLGPAPRGSLYYKVRAFHRCPPETVDRPVKICNLGFGPRTPTAPWEGTRPKPVRRRMARRMSRLTRRVLMTLAADTALGSAPGRTGLCGGSPPSCAFLARAWRQGLNEAGFAAGTSASNTLGPIGCGPCPLIIIEVASALGFTAPQSQPTRSNCMRPQEKSLSARVHSMDRHDRTSNLNRRSRQRRSDVEVPTGAVDAPLRWAVRL